jgi:hypothetical protein
MKAQRDSSSTALANRKAMGLQSSQGIANSSAAFGSANSLNLIDRKTYIKVYHGGKKKFFIQAYSSLI